MEASGGGRGGGAGRSEPLGFTNGAGASLFGATENHHHETLTEPIETFDRPNDYTATSSPSSNPDPVSFAFGLASSPAPPSMTSPRSRPAKPRPSPVRYRECLRNHAASTGGSVLDGCGEFMPSGEEGTIGALRCAACDCHRNFHRKESFSASAYGTSTASLAVVPVQLSPPPPAPILHYHHHGHLGTTARSSKPPYNSVTIVPPVSVAFGGGGTESSSEDLNLFRPNNNSTDNNGHHYFGSSSSKSSMKRFRTKFSQEQKDRMMEFAEKIGWRIQRQFEDDIERFCAEAGVRRQVFKVWMHNNKNATRSSSKQQQTPSTAGHDHSREED
ncbi:hypothetical protein SAY87_010370 [Trapa incisa]|uniref:ZF-HD dimerization-type domain-containing protein n=1 Tax=Trapa incisa TaxID=236973 RepID=A0AAN7GH04_9MYRT|nr:hypothetical protein SAY87_010370 [Trapa incisa]